MSGNPAEDRFRAVVGADLETLAALHDREMDAETLQTLGVIGFPRGMGLEFQSEAGIRALEMMMRVVDDLGPSTPDLLDELAAGYADVYLIHGVGASPSESPWIDKDGLERQQPMLDLRSWYARHGLRVKDWAVRPEDHIVHQLQFLALLIAQGQGDDSLDEAARFLAGHPLTWVSRFAERLEKRGGPPFYVALAALTSAYLAEVHDLLRRLVPPRPETSKSPEITCDACSG